MNVLDRLTYAPRSTGLASIPFPSGLAPKPTRPSGSPTDPLPQADVLVVFWTTAEAEALADVLTPGIHHTEWTPYARNWDQYEPQLTERSPARDERCMAHYCQTQVGSLSVLAVKSELHLATDGPSVPIVDLWRQMVADASPSLVISGGTAGGIGERTQLGDVFVATNAKFNCTKRFASEPWAQERYVVTPVESVTADRYWSSLTAPNADRLRPVATRGPEVTFGAGVETVDFFAFADATDSYGVVANDPEANTEEMDDATLPLALSSLTGPPRWLSIRTASDPQVPHMASLADEERWAEGIYEKYGYWAAVGAAVAAWCVIVDQGGPS